MASYKPGALSRLLTNSGSSSTSASTNNLFEKDAQPIVYEKPIRKVVKEPLAPEPESPKLRVKKAEMTKEDMERTVFVGNLPSNITRKKLRQLFLPYGKILSVRLRSAVPSEKTMSRKVAVIKHKFIEAQKNINGYVKFADADGAAAALDACGKIIDGRHINVDTCGPAKRYGDKATVFIGNLPFEADEEELHKHFADCGSIVRIRLVRDRATGSGKGFGFVVFEDPSSVSFALKLDNHEFSGRNLRITRVLKKKQLDAKKLPMKQKYKKKQNESERGRNESNKGEKQFKPLSKRVKKKIKRQQKNKSKSLMTNK